TPQLNLLTPDGRRGAMWSLPPTNPTRTISTSSNGGNAVGCNELAGKARQRPPPPQRVSGDVVAFRGIGTVPDRGRTGNALHRRRCDHFAAAPAGGTGAQGSALDRKPSGATECGTTGIGARANAPGHMHRARPAGAVAAAPAVHFL